VFAPLPARRLLVGLSSGTSADAVDVAVVEARTCTSTGENNFSLIGGGEVATPSKLRTAINNASSWSISELARRHFQVAEFHAAAALQILGQLKLTPRDIFAVGSHGQTIFHHDGDCKDGTLQVGDLNVLSNSLQIPVVGDFRWADLAGGGQGAPISVYADQVLHGATDASLAIVNLGGIANISLLRKGHDACAWDSGPANGLLDSLMRLETNAEFDENGQLAESGLVNPQILKKLCEIEFFHKSAPKSTGLEMFGSALVEAIRAEWPTISINDLLATFVELACWAICGSLRQFGEVPTRLYLAGGGVRNPLFAKGLRGMLGGDVEIECYSNLGWDSDLREAVAFSLLADAFFLHQAGSWPESTGTGQKCVLGKLAGANFSTLSQLNS